MPRLKFIDQNKTAPKLQSEKIKISKLSPHPRNYRKHPADQIQHLVKSIKENGMYRNVVVSNDNIILAGHGVVQALQSMNIEEVTAVRLNVDHNDSKALKVLIGDNEIEHLGDKDNKMLSNLLKEIGEVNVDDLLGTGFDDKMLSNLIFVSSNENEVPTFDAAEHWKGLPEYERYNEPIKIIVNFETQEDRLVFAEKLGYKLKEKTRSIWYPPKEKDDMEALRFE